MIDLVSVILFVVAIVLLFAGATLASYGVGIVGALFGAGGGYLLAPTVASTAGMGATVATVVAIPLGAAAGILVTYFVLSFAVAAVSFVVGIALGLSVLAPILVSGPFYVEWGVAIVIGLLAGMLAMMMTKTAMIFVTAFAGATLASGSLTRSDFETAQAATSVDPLVFDATAPIFLALFVLGVLSQFGLFKFGYVTRVVAMLPGAKALRDRGEKPDPEEPGPEGADG